MIKKFKLILNFAINMKPRYLGFRVYYLVVSRLGIIKKRSPVNPPEKVFISKEEWIKAQIPFFSQQGNFILSNEQKSILKSKIEKIKNHTFIFFSSKDFPLGKDYDWVTNPDTNFKYDINKHWSEINEFSNKAGDIKYVWEKARFTFLYDLIRYDYHFKEDQSQFVLHEIDSFIDSNPINQGPNYKCSQEISLRILNWIFALNYYKKSEILTNDLFQKIINSIYWQLHHIYGNINFSRIAVRNNHAITETATLYLAKYLFPFIPETKQWSKKGVIWLYKEINYQIYEDGSYLQFSHNYHRVVVQVLSWVLKLNQLNNVKVGKGIETKVYKTLDFLYQNQDEDSGWLPNYGNNDGALFFPLNANHYRDYRPQLQVLGNILGKNLYNDSFEDSFWLGVSVNKLSENKGLRKPILCFENGGFYGFRDNALTTIRCGKYKDRPAQADALNLDIWQNGENLILDPGTFKYNTEKEFINFYFGTKGHNTLVIGDYHQMIKGGRFIWYYWTKKAESKIEELIDRFEFTGQIFAFPQVGKNIFHERKVVKWKNELK